jgi:hypothetical protein
MTKEISDRTMSILTGRIYPAIQSCVSNRYKIVVGYFAVVGFLLGVDKEKLKELVETGSVTLLAIIFTLFVFHNLSNYWLNANEQQRLEEPEEQNKNKLPLLEIFSSAIMFILIWIGYCFLRLHANSA